MNYENRRLKNVKLRTIKVMKILLSCIYIRESPLNNDDSFLKLTYFHSNCDWCSLLLPAIRSSYSL